MRKFRASLTRTVQVSAACVAARRQPRFAKRRRLVSLGFCSSALERRPQFIGKHGPCIPRRYDECALVHKFSFGAVYKRKRITGACLRIVYGLSADRCQIHQPMSKIVRFRRRSNSLMRFQTVKFYNGSSVGEGSATMTQPTRRPCGSGAECRAGNALSSKHVRPEWAT